MPESRASGAVRRYRNFDLELYGHRLAAGHESFLVRVSRAPAGEQKHAEASAVGLPAGLRASVERFEAGALDAAQLVELGERIGEVLLPPGAARDLFDRSLGSLGEEEALRLRLRIEEPALACLPWELAYLPPPGTPAGERDQRGFLCLRSELSLTRYEPLPRPPRPFTPVKRPRVACLTSNPELPGTGRLDLAGEKERIADALAGAAVDLVFAESATLEGLRRSLADGAHLFHFGGHGTFSEEELGEIPRTTEGEGSLLFEDAEGKPLAVPADQIAVNLIDRKIRVAVLNSCYSGRRDAVRAWTGVGPVLAHERLPAVVANQFRVEDRAAIEFARGFYERLAAGAPIDSAVAAGRLAIFNLDPPSVGGWGSYVLYLRLADDSDGVVFPRRGEEGGDAALSPRFKVNLALASAVLLAVVALFYRQLEPRLPPSWLAGGGLGLFGLAGLLWAFLQFFAGEEIRGALRRALASRAGSATMALLLAAVAAGAWLLPVPSPPLLILPFGNINQVLPSPPRTDGLCALEVSQDGELLFTVRALARQAIVLGATEEKFRERISDTEFEPQLRQVLANLSVGNENQAGWVRLWSKAPRFVPGRLPGNGGPLTLRLVKDSVEEPLWVSEPRSMSQLEGQAIKAWVMEAKDGSKLQRCMP